MITRVRLQAELEDPLTELAELLDREQAEESRWQETLAALQSVREGRVVAEEEVHTWFESWGTPDERKPHRA
jgi:predicted transcriptional regulator